MYCPNISSPEWNNLINQVGEVEAWRTFFKYGEVSAVFKSIRTRTTEDIAEGIDRRLMISQKEIKYTSYIQSLFLDAIGEISPNKILDTTFESAFNKSKYKFVASLRNVNDFLKTIQSEKVFNSLKEKDAARLEGFLERFNLQGVKTYDEVVKAGEQYSQIVDNFDKYKDFVKAELLKMGIREVNGKIQDVNVQDVANQEEDDTEETLLAQNEIGERFDKSINEVNPLHTASAAVKSLVNNIQIPGKYELGIPLYANPADVFQDILSAGVDMKLGGYTQEFDKYKAFVTSLQSLVEARPYLAEFINKLENFKKNNQWDTINQVLTFASKAFANETLLLYKVNKVGKEVKGVTEAKTISINRESVEEQVAKAWFAQQLNSDFFDKNAQGDLFPNQEKVEKLAKIIEEGKAGTPDVQIAKFKEFFDILGIKFTDKQVKYFGDKLGDKLKKGKSFAFVFSSKGMLDNIQASYSKNLKTPFLSNYGIQNERKNLNKLAKLYYEVNPGMINVPSGKDAAGKSKYSNIQTNFVEIKKRQWNLGDTSYLMNSALAKPNKDFWTKVKNGTLTFSLDYFNGVREQEAGKDGKTRKNLTNIEQTRAMFMKHQESMNTGTYVIFTLSDKTTSMEVKMTKEFFVDNEMVPVGKGTDFKIANNELEYTDFFKEKMYNVFVEPEISRILAAIKYGDKVNLENFDAASKLFYILPIINNSPFLENFRKDLYSGNYTTEELKNNHGSVVSSVILNTFKESVEEDIDKYISDGIIKVDKGTYSYPSFKAGKVSDYLYRFRSTELKGRDLARAMVMDMKVNYMNAQVKTLQFLRFDPMVAFKKPKDVTTKSFSEYSGSEKVKIALSTWDEFSKRAAALIAPGGQGNWSWQLKNGERYFSKDYKAVTAADLSIVVNKVKNDTTDAEEFTTVQEHIDFLMSEGKIPESLWETITNKIKKAGRGGSYTLTDTELKFVFTPLKPVQVSDPNEGENTGLNRIDYVKSSRYPLIPQHEAGSERDKLRVWMEQNDISSVNFASGKKLGRPSESVTLFDKNGNFVEPTKEATEKATQVLSRDGLRTQQEIPHQKDEIATITQMNRTLLDGLLESVFNIEGLGELKGLELKKIKEAVRTRLFKLKSEELDKELGNLSVSHEGLYKLLKKTILEDSTGSYGENDLRALQIDPLTKKFAYPLELNPKAKKIQGLINSMINKNVMLKMNGSSFIQVSGVGAKFTFSSLSESIKSDIIWTDSFASTFKDGKASLAYISQKDGVVKPAQIIVSQYIKDEKGKLIDLKNFITEKNGVKILDTSKLDPKLLQLVASRIPNQSLPSTLPVEVVGFLPEYMEDTIIVPDGITGQMGSDFDIDKLYAYKSNSIATRDSKGNIIGYKSTPYSVKKVDDINTLNEDQLKEFYKDIHWAVLTNIDAFKKITKSIDSPEVTTKINKRKGLLEKYNISSEPSVLLPLDFNTSIKRHEDNRSGKDGVSVFANFISAQADFQDKPLELGYMAENEDGSLEKVPLPVYVKVNGEVLELIYIGQDGKSKSQAGNTYTVGENINIPFGESVDNAKNQNLREFNWDKKAMSPVGILSMLTTKDKKGLPIEFSMDLTSQEVIYDLFNRINRKQDSFEGFEPDAFVKSILEIEGEIKSKIANTEKFKDEESLENYLTDTKRKKESPLSVEKLENMWLVGKVLSSNNQAIFGAVLQEKAIAQGEDIRDIQEEKLLTVTKDLGYKSVNDLLLDYYVTQYDALELFSRLDDIGKEFMTILGSVYTYTKGIGPDVFTTLQKINQLNKLSKSSVFVDISKIAGDINKDTDSGIVSIVPEGEIGHSIYYSLIKAQSIYRNIFPISTGKNLETIVDSLLADKGLDKETLGRDKYITIYNDVFNAIKSYMYTMPGLELFSNLKSDRNRLINGDTSLGKSILDLQQSPEFITNGFLKYIEVEPQYKGDAYLLSFKAPFGTDMNEKEILSGFYELATSDNEIVREIARELALYPYATGDAGNIMRFIPVDYYMRDDDFQISIDDLYDTYILNMGSTDAINTLKDQLVQNNPEAYSVKLNYSTNNSKDNVFKEVLKPLINNAEVLKDVKTFKIKAGDFQANPKAEGIVKSLKVEKLTSQERAIASERNVDFKYPAYIMLNDSYSNDNFPENNWSVNYLYKRVSEAIPEDGTAVYERINILGYKNIKEYDFNNPSLQSSIKNNQVDVSQEEFTQEQSELLETVKELEVKPTTQPATSIEQKPLGKIALNIIEDWVQSGQATTTVRNSSYHNSFYKGDGVYTTDKGNLVNITHRGLVKLQGDNIVGNGFSYTKDEFAKAEGFGTWSNFEKGAKYAGKTLMDGGSVHLYDITPATKVAQPSTSVEQVTKEDLIEFIEENDERDPYGLLDTLFNDSLEDENGNDFYLIEDLGDDIDDQLSAISSITNSFKKFKDTIARIDDAMSKQDYDTVRKLSETLPSIDMPIEDMAITDKLVKRFFDEDTRNNAKEMRDTIEYLVNAFTALNNSITEYLSKTYGKEEETEEVPSALVGYKDKNFIVEGTVEEGFKVFYTDASGVKTKQVEDQGLYDKVTLSYLAETYPENVVTLIDMPTKPRYYIDIAGEIYSLQESTYGAQITSDDIHKRVNDALAGKLENDTDVKEFAEETIKKSLDPASGKRINVPEGSNPNNMVIFEDETTKYLMNDGQQEAYNFIKSNVERLLKEQKRVRADELEDTVSFLDPLSQKFSGVIPKAMWDNMIGLAGRGGVGKTTVIRAIMDSLETANKYSKPSIMYLTPSHTAATVLQESLGLDSEKANDGTVNTIPAAVRRNKIDSQSGELIMANEEDYENGLRFRPAFSSPDVIIVDESSMVTTRDIKDMLVRTKYDLENLHSTKMPIFIFMGDYRQLGPIGEQQNPFVNKGIISSTLLLNKEKTKELTQVMRSGDKNLHQIYDAIGNEIIDNIERTKQGQQPRQLSFDKYDQLTSKSTENILVVDNELGVIDDYTDFLAENNNPYGMFWVHYNRVENPNTINLAEKIRKLYFQKIGKQIDNVNHRSFSAGDYIEFTDALEIGGAEFRYRPTDDKLNTLLKSKNVPFKSETGLFSISGGMIKPRSRYKVLEIVQNQESIKSLVPRDISKHFSSDFDVKTENILLYNRQNKIRGYRKILGLQVELGTYNSKTKFRENIKIKNAETGEVLASFSVHYSEFKNISEQLKALSSKKMPFTPSYVGSSHTAQGNSIKNVIVGDYNVKQARMNSQINQDDIFSSMYVSLTRTSGTLVIIKPRGARILNNQNVFQGAIRDDNKSKTKLDSSIKPASTSVAPSVGETTSVKDVVDPIELDMNSLASDAMNNALQPLFKNSDVIENSKDFLNNFFKQANNFNKNIITILAKTGFVTPFRVVIDNNLKNPGEYNNFTKTISINPKLILDENNSMDLGAIKQSLHDVIMHELMHHLTADMLMTKPENLSKEQREWVENLTDLFNAVQQKMLQDPVHGPALQRAIDQVNREDGMLSSKDKSMYYGLTNVHDFISMLMTDANFQEFMNNVTYDGKKSILDRIIDMISDLLKLLNINVKNDSVLKEGLTNIIGLIQSRNKNDQNSVQKSIVTKEVREKNISDNFTDIVRALSIKIKC